MLWINILFEKICKNCISVHLIEKLANLFQIFCKTGLFLYYCIEYFQIVTFSMYV